MSFRKSSFSTSSLAVLAIAGLVATGCASSEETAQKDTLTEHVGQYDPAPKGVNKPRVGVPAFSVKSAGSSGGREAEVEALAADQMSTLLDNSERVSVIERAQLQKLLDEQNMEGIVRPGEMAKTGQVRGVDFLLLGKVTNLRVKKENKERGFGLATIGGFINTGGADVKKTDTIVTTECGVDIRMVNPTTGETLWSNFSEYKKTDSVGAFGLKILGADADAKADLDISEDDKGKILRLALDDALRKSLPKFDKFLKSEKNVSVGGEAPASAAPVAPISGTPAVGSEVPANASSAAKPAGAVAAKKFCPQCGSEVAAGAKFCPKDGTKID